MYIAFSKYGKIVLGKKGEKPKYSFFTWGSMMFTCGLAADIIFYSFAEWLLYANEPYTASLGDVYEWSSVFPLFHWSFIPWAMYLVLAVAFGYMLHVKKKEKQKYSEACRPILGKWTDKFPGRIIDLLAVFALLAGTATTFSVATPLMAEIVKVLFNVTISRTTITIIILLITCFVYTYSLLHGLKGMSVLAKACIYLFFGSLIYVLIFGGQAKFIIENGFGTLGKMVQNFIGLSTYSDPLRTSGFPQSWTIYYWAYWMVWCIAAPFFIGNISKGRTIKQTILGGYVFGVGSTIVSFIVLGNYSLGLQLKGTADFIAQYETSGDLYDLIISMINTIPYANFVLILTMICMITFYATSFDSIAYTAACYSYKELKEGEKPHNLVSLLWCLLLIVLPIALVFSESSMRNIQSISIISAFPIGLIMIAMILGLFRDMKKYLSLLIAILFTLSLNAGGGKAKIVFDSTRYDFGYIQEDKGKVPHSFKFTNDGAAPLIIIYTRSTCGCTASHFTKEPVAPAGTGSIDVTFDTEGRPGTFRKEVKVYTNARKASIKLIIEGIVVPKK